MAEGTADTPPARPPRRGRGGAVLRWIGGVLLALAVLAALVVAVLDSPIGHRYVADRIAELAPASGLRITVDRIDGSLYGQARLRGLTFADSRGVFARVPEAELDWRPLAWFRSGLDVRKLVLRRGVLLRLPKLEPGDPDAPILPDFDIRVDRLEIDRLTIAKGVLGPQARRASLVARADIRDGRAYVRTEATVGGGDRLVALLDSEPARDRFDIALDYAGRRDGLLASLAGIDSAITLRIAGKGGWQAWNGGVLASQDGARLAALKLTARAGRYALLGLAWPGDLLSGLPARAAGREAVVGADWTLDRSVWRGNLSLRGQGLGLRAGGTADLAGNAFDGFRLDARVLDPALLGPGARLEGATLSARLDGPFKDMAVDHRLAVARLVAGTTRVEGLAQAGVATFEKGAWTLPLQLTAARIVTGNAMLDPRLVGARATGTVRLEGTRISAEDLAVGVPGLSGRFVLRGDTARGGYGLAGNAVARGFVLENVGTADAEARLVARLAGGAWELDAQATGRLPRVANATLTNLAGTGIRFSGDLSVGSARPLLVRRATLSGSKLALGLSGRVLPGGAVSIDGRGRQEDYGPFTVAATLADDGPRAVLVFADPLPAAGLKDVRVALSPIPQGFRIETEGGSMLGPFSGTLGLYSPPGGPTRIDVQRLEVWKTAITGALTLGAGGADGRLALSGGGIDGTIDLDRRGGGQGFAVLLNARDARFAGPVPLTIASGRLEAQGLLRAGHLTVNGSLLGQGIGQGRLFIGRVAANASVSDGRGRVTAAIAGRRGSRFDLQVLADFAPRQVALSARGAFAGRPISMPRRAVLTATDDGWRLAPTQVNFAGGRLVASGLLGGRATELDLALADMPLSLADIVVTDLGLGGRISGLVGYRAPARGSPTADFRVKVSGLTRSGLVLTSRPIDLALVGALEPDRLELRAVASEGGQARGRVQGRIAGLPTEGSLAERLRRGALFAQLRYDGPADALWRLAALEGFDLTGPLSVAADATGTLADPQIRGSLASDALRLQSSLTGTDVSGMKVRGSFSGSRLVIATINGTTPGGGTVGGSGSFDLSGLGERGPGIDLRLAARSARLLARADMAATVTGPLLVRSDGVQGLIAGRLAIEKAEWRLGRASGIEELPNIRTREINRPADIAAPRAASAPWRFLIDARGDSRVAVSGLGLDSEWGADIRLRGTTAAPAISGRADLVRGGYEFAGKRFELTRGRINFDGNSPPDPRLDIAAELQESGLTARVTVRGTSLRPEIDFTSTPALPQEELLARLLFGSSITDISAPEALQLGAAIASLRGGGGLDPINRLRKAIGLDRLRIVPADAALGRGTGVAAGKNLGRRLYAEIVTDGRGYSATQLEFRVTSWLSLLAAMSTAGHESLNVKASKDY